MLVFCNITNKIRKRTDTAVAFTQEYSNVSYPLGNVSTLPMGSSCPRTHTHWCRRIGKRGLSKIQNLCLEKEITSPLYFEILVSTGLCKPIAPIIRALSNIRTWSITRARTGLSPPTVYLYKPWDYQTTEWYSLAQTPRLRYSLLTLALAKTCLFYPRS